MVKWVVILKCVTCSSVLDKFNDISNLAFPWYKDEKNTNHTGFVCTRCFTVYDCVGSLNIIATLSGRQGMKIVTVFTPEELNNTLSRIAAESQAIDVERGITDSEIYYEIPAALLHVHLYIPSDIANKLVESGKIHDPIKKPR